MPPKIKFPDLDHWVAKYLDGMSVNQIAKETGISRGDAVGMARSPKGKGQSATRCGHAPDWRVDGLEPARLTEAQAGGG